MKKTAIDALGKARRSACPTNYIVELIGDRWSLLIIRDMLFNGKQSFGEFLSSEEGIARNILSSKLRQLEENKLILKQPHPSDGRKDIYVLSEKGKQLRPVLLAMSDWSFNNEPMTSVHRTGS